MQDSLFKDGNKTIFSQVENIYLLITDVDPE